MHSLLQISWSIGLLLLCSLQLAVADQARELFERSSEQVFQIRVIDRVSDNKAFIGSGFQVRDDGVVATNYHVVAQYIKHREKYRIELVDHVGGIHTAELLNFDIVQDLALLQAQDLGASHLSFNANEIDHGENIYSMGNPQDLGITIIEGNYNGLVEGARHQKYLFSGALNSGMSGGPALNDRGEVIGINVSKRGDNLSFLVPVSHLITLLEVSEQALDPADYREQVRLYLQLDQAAYYQALQQKDWAERSFGPFVLPDQFDSSLRCWGHSLEQGKKRYQESHRHCNTEDRTYIEAGFFTGSMYFDYSLISNDGLTATQFYHLLSAQGGMRGFSNNRDKEDTSNLQCATRFIQLGGRDYKWKATTCIREYLDYRGLYDAGLVAVMVDASGDKLQAFKIQLHTYGIDRANIEGMHRKFLEMVTWAK